MFEYYYSKPMSFIKSYVILGILIFVSCKQSPQLTKPINFIVIFADDLGYGDLSSFGHPTIKTPNLDRMATEGQKWTNFYAGASVCTPSRAALLTGRLPIRSGMSSNKHRVLFTDSHNGLPNEEITLAEQLKKANYTTACIGKWHLGHKEAYLPLQHGFDYYFGIPYSNDMDVPEAVLKEKGGYWNVLRDPKNNLIKNFQVPLIKNNEIIERPADQNNITRRYSEETIKFIKKNKNKPFFIYLAHNLPHVPLFASKEALGKSSRGLYGDVVEEIDHGVGKILNTLKEEGLDKNTLVVFTSDNGPWTAYNEQGGSAGLLRAGKGTTWEGGMREPTIFWAPERISPGIIDKMGSTMDIFNTFSNIAGVSLPEDRILDSYDLSPLLFENKNTERDHLFYYRGTNLYAIRLGDFKAHYVTQGEYGQFGEKEIHNPPLLYNLNQDPSEQYNIALQHPDILQAMKNLVMAHQEKMIPGEDQLKNRGGE
jgi:arylsulfatase A-like enzyme